MERSRRMFLRELSGAALGVSVAATRGSEAQTVASPAAQSVRTAVLSIGCEESGARQGFPIILLHGFPDDVRAYDDVAPPLVNAGFRVLVPYLRGYGPTRFLDDE